MARHTVTFDNETTRNFLPNSRRTSPYSATIQNNTGETVTITVTNEEAQGTGQTFVQPAGGAVAPASGAMAQLNEPYDLWLLTAGAATTGTVDIEEAG